jgi:signal transduction histidine kinase
MIRWRGATAARRSAWQGGLLGLLLLSGLAAQAPTPPEWLERARVLLSTDAEAALALADQALAEAVTAADADAEFEARSGRAGLQRQLGRYGEAVLDFEHGRAIAQRLQDPLREARAQASLGVVLTLSGLYPEAMEALQDALALFSAQGEWPRASGVLTNLGNLHAEHGDLASAREHYRRALAMKREHGIDAGIGGLLNNLADIDREAGDLSAARAGLEEAVALHLASGEAVSESLARGNLGLVLALLGEYAQALQQLDRAEQLAAHGEVRLLAAVFSARAEAYLGMAVASTDEASLRQQRLLRARAAVVRARSIAAGMDDPRRRARLAELASRIHAELEQPEAALALLREASEQYREHDRRADSARQAVLAARYRDAQHRGEIAELRERDAVQGSALQRQRWLAALLGGGALALAVLAALLQRQVRQRRRHAMELTARNIALGDALLEAEEQRLRAERLSAANQRLLALAGDDLRGPLLRIRGTSERLLVEHRGASGDEAQIAAIAQAASELMRVAEQMTESAAGVDDRAPVVEACNLLALLREVVAQFDGRFLGREQRLQLRGDSRTQVRIDRPRLQRVLHELIDAMLQHNPGQTPIGIDLRRRDAHIELAIDDPGGTVLQRLSTRSGGVGLAYADAALTELGGELQLDREHQPPRLLLWLPAG